MAIATKFALFLDGFRDLLFPPACLACGVRLAASTPPLLCTRCLDKLIPLRPPLCTCCGKPLADAAGAGHRCGRCLGHPPAFVRARALFLYDGPVVEIIQHLKYHGDTAGLATIAHLCQAAARLDPGEPDIILPVPLHLERLRQRGFNQSQRLAAAFFPEHREKIRLDILARRRQTLPQTGMSGAERRRNLKNAFAVVAAPAVRRRSVLLVDDVYTTGSTVHECARVLRRAGAAAVEVLTLARVRD